MYFPRIEDLRIDSDRKQYEVAAYLHLNREVYRRYEKGEQGDSRVGGDSAGPAVWNQHGLYPGLVRPAMILLWFTAGVVPAVLLGVYLPWSAWVLPVGLGSLAADFCSKG